MTLFYIWGCAFLFEVPFSQAIEMRMKYLDSILVEIGDQIERLIRLKGQNLNEVESKILDSLMETQKKEYKKMKYKINALRYPKKNKVTDEMVEYARNYDFHDLIEIPARGNIKCPFHKDNHPSASIRNNKLHCFSCNKTWNPIDYIMEKDNLKFKEAVLFLQ